MSKSPPSKQTVQGAYNAVAVLVDHTMGDLGGMSQDEGPSPQKQSENDYISYVILPKLWKLAGKSDAWIKETQRQLRLQREE